MTKKKTKTPDDIFSGIDNLDKYPTRPLIRTPWTAHQYVNDNIWPVLYEHPDQDLPSKTLPDQTMSIKELLDRNARGLPLGGQRVPIYEPDSDLPDPRRLDLAEREELALQYAQELQDLKAKEELTKQLKSDADKAAMEAREEAQFKRYQEYLENKKKPDTPA